MTPKTAHASTIAEKVTATLQKLLPKGAKLHEPYFPGREAEYVRECVETGWVSSVGKFVDRFEADLARIFEVKSAVAIVNGTSALHIALKMAGVEASDEVLVPALSFVAPANAISYCGAAPHFVDCEPRSMGVDAAKLDRYLQKNTQQKNGECFNKKTGRRIKALVVVHVFGHPADMDALLEVCARHHIVCLEDAAESLGSLYKGRPTAHHGLLTALSFNGNKIVTTGGGGAVLTNDETLGKKIKHLTTTAKVPHAWRFDHDAVGYNYRLPNLNAALGCAQLERLPEFIQKKRELASRYAAAFKETQGVTFFSEPEYAKSNYWLNVLWLDTDRSEELENVLKLTNEKGLMTRPAWTPLSELPMYAACERMDLSCATDLSRRLLNIPSSVFL